MEETMAAVPTTEETIADVAGPSHAPPPSSPRTKSVLTEMKRMINQRCNRLMNANLTDEQVQQIEAAAANCEVIFRSIGVEMNVNSWELNPAMPTKRNQPIDRQSHSMPRMDWKVKESKKSRAIAKQQKIPRKEKRNEANAQKD